ncbi:MAG: hypothetical protein QXT69_02790 [Fervidicoccaceae archaeon]
MLRRNPWQMELRIEGARKIEKMCTGIKACEDILLEGGRDISIDFDRGRIFASGNISRDVIEGFKSRYGEKISLVLEEDEGRGIPLKDAYLTFAEEFHFLGKEALELVVGRTAMVGMEHAVFITDDGTAIAIEGERDRVLFPPSSLCIAIHTHPSIKDLSASVSCFPSTADLRNAVSFFLDGGILFGIACRGFALYIQRTWIVTDEMLESLADLPKKAEKILNSWRKSGSDPLLKLREIAKGLPLEISLKPLD